MSSEKQSADETIRERNKVLAMYRYRSGAFREASLHVMKHAGGLFCLGKDEMASEMRSVANDLLALANKEETLRDKAMEDYRELDEKEANEPISS